MYHIVLLSAWELVLFWAILARLVSGSLLSPQNIHVTCSQTTTMPVANVLLAWWRCFSHHTMCFQADNEQLNHYVQLQPQKHLKKCLGQPASLHVVLAGSYIAMTATVKMVAAQVRLDSTVQPASSNILFTQYRLWQKSLFHWKNSSLMDLKGIWTGLSSPETI